MLFMAFTVLTAFPDVTLRPSYPVHHRSSRVDPNVLIVSLVTKAQQELFRDETLLALAS